MPETALADATRELFEAIAAGDGERVTTLIAGRPELANAPNEGGTSPLLTAAYCRQPAVAELLLGAGAELGVHAAAARGDGERIVALLEAKPAQVKARSGDGWTALHLAAHFGHANVVALLLIRGAEVDARSTNGLNNTALHAALAGRHREVVELLLANGADVNAQQHGGFTALQAAAMHGDLGLVALLLERGADPSLRTATGQRALDMAAEKSHAEVVDLLRRHGATA